MGAAYSILSMSTKEAKEKYSHFTEEERKENEAAEKIQLEVVEIASNYFYYGMPVKVNKQSADPLSPVWLTADTKEMKERLDAQQRQSTSTGGSRTIISLGNTSFLHSPFYFFFFHFLAVVVVVVVVIVVIVIVVVVVVVVALDDVVLLFTYSCSHSYLYITYSCAFIYTHTHIHIHTHIFIHTHSLLILFKMK